jgi:hypothetical protein
MPNPFDGNPRNQPENISRAHAISMRRAGAALAKCKIGRPRLVEDDDDDLDDLPPPPGRVEPPPAWDCKPIAKQVQAVLDAVEAPLARPSRRPKSGRPAGASRAAASSASPISWRSGWRHEERFGNRKASIGQDQWTIICRNGGAGGTLPTFCFVMVEPPYSPVSWTFIME